MKTNNANLRMPTMFVVLETLHEHILTAEKVEEMRALCTAINQTANPESRFSNVS